MLLQLVSQMQWPFATVCIAFLLGCAVVYVTRRVINANELVEKNQQLSSENYRLTHTRSEE